MQKLIIAGIIAASTSAAVAAPFDFQRQIGSTEYDAGYDTAQLRFAPVQGTGKLSSLTAWMLAANVDGVAGNEFTGRIDESGPSRISLYEFVRDSPEGIAYRDYHERYPVGTDWAQVAREYRESRMQAGLAADIPLGGNDS